MLTTLRFRVLAISVIALITVLVPIWSLLAPHTQIENVRALDGCYEGEGLPDFMRPPHHWSLRINGGRIVDRNGNPISRVHVIGRGNNETPVSFSPGILVAGKPETVMAGDTVTGKAYVSGGRVTIVLADELQQILLSTTCS